MFREYKIEKDFMVDGFRCVITGSYLGHRCGYIGIPKGHELYEKHYDTIPLMIHGGLTYSNSDAITGYPVEADLWWIGFDTAHYNDSKDFDLIKELADERMYNAMLEMESMYPTQEFGEIRTTEYVENELINAVRQIKEMGMV